MNRKPNFQAKRKEKKKERKDKCNIECIIIHLKKVLLYSFEMYTYTYFNFFFFSQIYINNRFTIK